MLDNIKFISKIDKSGMFDTLEKFPDQIRDPINIALRCWLPTMAIPFGLESLYTEHKWVPHLHGSTHWFGKFPRQDLAQDTGRDGRPANGR